MTRPQQKQSELEMVQAYMDLVSLVGTVSGGGEPPDFIIQSQAGAIAVEVLEYHRPRPNKGEHTRREVESAWQALRDFVVEYRKIHPELDRLHVRLDFTRSLVPPKKKLPEFVEAVRAIIMPTVEAARAADDKVRKRLKIGDGHPDIVRQYLSAIEVRISQAYLEWDWNRDFAGVGTNDSEMVEVVRRKIETYKPIEGVVQNVLVVVGWRGLLSEMIAPMGAWQFAGFARLNGMLTAGPFDQVAVLCTRDLLWRRGAGWHDITRAAADR